MFVAVESARERAPVASGIQFQNALHAGTFAAPRVRLITKGTEDVPHYKSMYDRDYIYAFDLMGRDVVVTIAKVVAGELTAAGGRKSKKPVVYFEGKDKGLALNKTNGKTIASLFGTDTDQWIGKKIAIYPTETSMGGETVECIRVRNKVPT